MKNILILLLLTLFSFKSFGQKLSIERAKILLEEKNLSIDQLKSSGAKILLGEGSGAGFTTPYQDVLIVLTDGEAILKDEISSPKFEKNASLNELISLEIPGAIIYKDQVKGVIYK